VVEIVLQGAGGRFGPARCRAARLARLWREAASVGGHGAWFEHCALIVLVASGGADG